MVRFGRLCRRLALVGAVLALGGAGGLGSAPAGAADQCLPPPQVLLSEVARVAGTGSQLWADIQATEDADAAAGTSGPGQVVQDLLSTTARDGYQWDCAGSQLVAPAGAPPRVDPPPETTVPAPPAGSGATGRAPSTVAGAGVGGHPSTVPAAGGPTVTGGGDSTVPPDTSGGAAVSTPPDTSTGASVLAAPAASSSGGGGGSLSTILLLVLAAGSGLLVIVVVRRQLARR